MGETAPNGVFMMGSPDDEADRYDDEGPKHEATDRKSTRLNSSHSQQYRMPSSAWKKKNKLSTHVKYNSQLEISHTY